MKTIIQTQFGEPAGYKSLRDEPLLVHQRTESSASRHLIVFVHGLGGSRYGKNSTWGTLPGYIFEDFPQLDIGLYSFRSALRRLACWRSIPIPREAEVLGGVLRTLHDDRKYDAFILIGHSLGGLLCKGAVAALDDNKQQETLESISDLLLMATPQLGSLRVPAILQNLTEDVRVLRAHSDFIQRVVSTFQTRIHCAIAPSADEKIHIRAWAVIAAADAWVDPLSAGVGIDDSQRLTVAGTHTEIVKPLDKNAESYRFLHRVIERALKPRPAMFRSETSRPTRFDELSDLHDFAASFFTEPVSDLHIMQAWWNANNEVFQVIERITKIQGRVSMDTVGYFCVLPVSAAAANDLRSGTIAITALTESQIVPQGTTVTAAYIGAVAGVDAISQGTALNFLQAHLRYLAAGAPLTLITRPVTPDGLRLVKGFSFQPVEPVTGNALGIVHENTLSGFNREMRKAHRRRPAKF